MPYNEDKYNPLADDQPTVTHEEVDAAIYGTMPRSELVKVWPVEIDKIWADIKQPRRVIPGAVRGEWDGDPAGVAELIGGWLEMVHDIVDYTIDMTRLVMGNGEGSDDARTGDSVVDGLLTLCSLAASILHDGLTNPITIVPHYQGRYLIETGERRWLAHHLLVIYAHDKYKKMAARVVDKFDIYRQASENGARESLNAISKARQLAILIMDMYTTEDNPFDDYNFMTDGHCDRLYYAQVADGKKRKIKDGHGQRILDVTGIKNMVMVSRYRDLLNLPDKLWEEGDERNWTEGYLRGQLAQFRRSETIARKWAKEEQQRRDASVAQLTEPDPPPIPDSATLPIGNDQTEIFSIGDEVLFENLYGKIMVLRLGDAWVDFGSGLPRQVDITKLTLVDRMAVIEDDGQVDDVYVPESFEDAQARPELGRLLVALSDYCDQCPHIDDDEIAYSLEYMLATEGQIAKEQENDWGGADTYRDNLKTAKKAIRWYLEKIAGHIDDWASELIDVAEGYHQQYWGEDE